MTATNIMIMKMFEILGEYQSMTQTRREQILLEESCQQACWTKGCEKASFVTTKNTISVKHNKVQKKRGLPI